MELDGVKRVPKICLIMSTMGNRIIWVINLVDQWKKELRDPKKRTLS